MNSQKTIFVVIAMLSASIALADDFKTIAGKEYKDATVTHVEPDGIVVRSKSGISKIYFAELPPEVQQRFHYEPQTAAAAQANEMAANQQTNQQISAGDQQKNLESQLSQLQQQEENLRVQIEQAKNAPRSKQPSKTGPSLATQAHEESLTAKGKERQLKRRQKEYEGAKQAAARNGLNANNIAPPRYGDAAKYQPNNQGGGTAQNAEQGAVTRADLPVLKSQLDAVRQQREQVQRELAEKRQPSK